MITHSNATCRRPYFRFLVLLLGGFAVLYQVKLTESYSGLDTAALLGPRWPLFVDAHRPSLVVATEPEAKVAGLASGDLITSIDGKPSSTSADFIQTVRSAHVGQTISVYYQHEGGPIRFARVRLKAPYLVLDINKVIRLFILPGLCLGLGLWVTWRRPRVPHSWALLALMTSFAVSPTTIWAQAAIDTWPVFIAIPATAYRVLAETTWPLWMILFGYYFPRRLRGPSSRLIGYLTVAIGLPLLSLSLLQAIAESRHFLGDVSTPVVTEYLSVLQPSTFLLFIVGFGAFFALISVKIHKTGSSDNRRRLRIVYAGTTLSMIPLFLLQLVNRIPLHSPIQIHVEITSACYLCLYLFPLTLAFATQVENAVDLVVIARQSIHYVLTERVIRSAQILCLMIAASDATLLLSDERHNLLLHLSLLVICLASLVYLQQARLTLRDWTDRILFGAARRNEKFLLDFCSLVAREHAFADPEHLLFSTGTHLVKAFDIWEAATYLQADGNTRLIYSHQPSLPDGMRELPLGPNVGELSVVESKNWLSAEEAILPFESRDQVTVPLLGRDELLGFIKLGWRSGRCPYTSVDLSLIRKVAEQVGLRLDNMLLARHLTTEISAREARIAEQNAANQANRLKSEFMARMSHELRNPLNAIIGYSELLEEDIDDCEQQDLLRDIGRIQKAGKHLLTLINSILDIAKIESGRLEIYCEPTDIRTIVGDAIAFTQPLVEQNRNHLESAISQQCGSMVTDAVKVRQILCNLLGNAAKFSQDSMIRVTVTACSQDSREFVRIAVTDEGVGVTEEQIKKLFQPYVQADTHIQRIYGGSGLGLAICRSYCEALGGSIDVESTFGEGSTFTVLLPRFGKTSSKEEAPVLAVPIAKIPRAYRFTLLVIDDDQLTSQLIQKDLEEKNVRVLSAYTSEEGLALAHDQRPDLILLDVLITTMTGWEVLERLKWDPNLSVIPVVILSICDERQRGISLGASSYVTKPVGRSKLLAEICRFLDLPTAIEKHSHEVLIINDDQTSREAVARDLAKAGWTVRYAEEAQEALQMIGKNTPELILLDLLFPEVGRVAFLTAMCNSPQLCCIPVLLIAGNNRSRAEAALNATNVDIVPRKERPNPGVVASRVDAKTTIPPESL